MTERLAAASAVLALALAAAPVRADVANNDAQIWQTTRLLVQASDRIKALAEVELRVGDGMSDLVRYHADLGLRLTALEQKRLVLSVDLAYRQAFWKGYFFDEPSSLTAVDEAWVAESRPHASFTVTVPLGNFVLADTVRLDLRMFDRRDMEVRLQEMLVAALDIHAGKGGYVFRLFAALGIAAELHPDPAYERTRIYAGLMFPVAGPLGLNVYYMWQRFRVEPGWWSWHMGWDVPSTRDWNWHVLGLTVSVAIDTLQDPAGGAS